MMPMLRFLALLSALLAAGCAAGAKDVAGPPSAFQACDAVPAQEWTRSLARGRKATEEELRDVVREERTTAISPTKHALLLSYYAQKRSLNGDEIARVERSLGVLIRECSSAVIWQQVASFAAILSHDRAVYLRSRALWRRESQRHPNDPRVLASAADFMIVGDDDVEALRLVGRAIELSASNFRYYAQRARLYARLDGEQAKQVCGKHSCSEEAHNAFEEALALAESERRSIAVAAARAALHADDFVTAEKLANGLIGGAQRDDAPILGDELHHGHLVLGSIALARKDVDSAKRHLLLAAMTSGSAVLSTFGPNMALAKQLLELGERDVVLEYLRRCASFWDRPQLAEWSASIQRGEVPDFGPHLSY